MGTDKLVDHLQGSMKLILGPDGTGKGICYYCMEFDPSKKILRFNTDVDYKMNDKTDEVMKMLCEKFNIKKYQINVIYVGELGLDLDIVIDLDNFEKEKIAEIISFIKDNFYDSGKWIYENL